jgi:hypothetical protein
MLPTNFLYCLVLSLGGCLKLVGRVQESFVLCFPAPLRDPSWFDRKVVRTPLVHCEISGVRKSRPNLGAGTLKLQKEKPTDNKVVGENAD